MDKDNLKCMNCKNFCHEVSECLLRACGKCQKFNVGHKSDECPAHNELSSRPRDSDTSSNPTLANSSRGANYRGRGYNQPRGRGNFDRSRGRGNQQSSRGRSIFLTALIIIIEMVLIPKS